MSDRTQTLSVIRVLEGVARLDLTAKLRVGLTNSMIEEARQEVLPLFLSQPEHQGDEKAEQIIARIVARSLRTREKEIGTGFNKSETPNGIAQEILAALPAQPPAPVLSDEEREQPREHREEG